MHSLQLGCCLEAVKNRHRDIDYKYVGVKTLHFGDSFSPIAHCPDDVELVQ